MRKVIPLVLILIFGAQVSRADVITFKDGRVFEGEVIEDGESIWVDGIKFNREGIAEIKRKALFRPKVKTSAPKKKPWYKDLFKWPFKSKQERARERELKQIRERRQKTDEALQAAREKRKEQKDHLEQKDKEIKKASTPKTPSESSFHKSSPKGSPSGHYGKRY